MAFAGIFLFLLLPLGLLVGAVILRGAIGLANRQIGPPPAPPYVVEDEDDWGDYPIAGEQPKRPVSNAIPTPSTGGAMFVVLVVLIVNGIATFVFQLMMDDEMNGRRGPIRGPLDELFDTRLLSFPISFALTAGLFAVLLPTTFKRGCLVALFYLLICFAIAVGFSLPAFVVASLFV